MAELSHNTNVIQLLYIPSDNMGKLEAVTLNVVLHVTYKFDKTIFNVAGPLIQNSPVAF